MSKPKEGITPRAWTKDAWLEAFMSWSVVDQDNALREIELLRKWSRKGRLGSLGQPTAVAQPSKPVEQPASQNALLPMAPVASPLPETCPHGGDNPEACAQCVAGSLPL